MVRLKQVQYGCMHRKDDSGQSWVLWPPLCTVVPQEHDGEKRACYCWMNLLACAPTECCECGGPQIQCCCLTPRRWVKEFCGISFRLPCLALCCGPFSDPTFYWADVGAGTPTGITLFNSNGAKIDGRRNRPHCTKAKTKPAIGRWTENLRLDRWTNRSDPGPIDGWTEYSRIKPSESASAMLYDAWVGRIIEWTGLGPHEAKAVLEFTGDWSKRKASLPSPPSPPKSATRSVNCSVESVGYWGDRRILGDPSPSPSPQFRGTPLSSTLQSHRSSGNFDLMPSPIRSRSRTRSPDTSPNLTPRVPATRSSLRRTAPTLPTTRATALDRRRSANLPRTLRGGTHGGLREAQTERQEENKSYILVFPDFAPYEYQGPESPRSFARKRSAGSRIYG